LTYQKTKGLASLDRVKKFSFDGFIVSIERGTSIPPAVFIAEQQSGLNPLVEAGEV
jgi:hypothetical protein